MTATTPASIPSSVGANTKHQRADIQGLRAVAVIVVVVFHAGLPLPGGFTGVDMFFVISGFVITGLLIREREKGTWSLRTFFARRSKRLLPALALMVFVVLIASLLLESPLGAQSVTAQTAIGAMLISANVVIARTTGGYFEAAAEANPLLHTWSLSVEEQFYLLFPLLLLLGWRMRRHWLPFLLIVFGMMSFLLSIALSFGFSPWNLTSQPEAWAFYLSVTRAWEFLAGAGLALWLHARPRIGGESTLALPVALVGLGAVVTGLFVIGAMTPFPGFAALLPVGGTVALIWAGTAGTNVVSRGLSSNLMVATGDRSYSIYLWHWPVILFAVMLFPGVLTAVMAAALSLIPALLSYRFVEQPIRMRPMTSRLRVLLWSVGVSIFVIVSAFALMYFGARILPFSDDRGETVGRERGCLLLDQSFAPQDIARCTFTTPDAKGWILLTGDSHAESLSNAVVQSGNALGYDVVAVTGALCPTVRDNRINFGVPNCAEMAETLLDTIASDSPPDLVVISHKGVPVGIELTYEELESAGIPVIRIQDVPRWRPRFENLGPDPCSGGLLNFQCEQPVASVLANAPADRDLEMKSIKPFGNIVNVDPWPIFCGTEVCSPILDGELAYVDAGHLSPVGSEALIPLIREAMSQALASR